MAAAGLLARFAVGFFLDFGLHQILRVGQHCVGDETRSTVGRDAVNERAPAVRMHGNQAVRLGARFFQRRRGIGCVLADAKEECDVETHRRRDDVRVRDIGGMRLAIRAIGGSTG